MTKSTLLLALLGVGERRHADVEGAALDRRDDLGEVGLAVLRGQAEGRRDRVHQIDIEADDLAARILELVGRVGHVHADDELAGGLDVLGHHVRDVVDLRGLRGCGLGRRARGIRILRAPRQRESPRQYDDGQAAPPSRTPPTGLVSSFHVASSFCIGSSSAAQPMTLTTMDPARIAGNGTVIKRPHSGRTKQHSSRLRFRLRPGCATLRPWKRPPPVLFEACCPTVEVDAAVGCARGHPRRAHAGLAGQDARGRGILFGAYLLISGISQVFFAFSLHVSAGGRILLFISGAASFILAVLAFRQFEGMRFCCWPSGSPSVSSSAAWRRRFRRSATRRCPAAAGRSSSA